MKIDLHFHSSLSDWRKDSSEMVKIAKAKWLDFAVCTDHDVVNKEFSILANKAWIKSCEAVEISSNDEKYSQHLHLTCYSKHFSRNIDNILKESMAWRQEKSKRQIRVLKNNGFNISEKKFLEFFIKKWVNVENINSYHISSYIYCFPENIILIEKLTWEKMDKNEFLKQCLKEEWRFPWVWSVRVDEYVPNLQTCWRMAKENNAILSVAHPNFKLTQEEFKERIEHYLNCWINWVEINSKATKSWVKLILKYQKKYDYIITFWSDCHFRENEDDEHWEFWEMNSFVSQDLIDLNMYYFEKKLWLMKNFYLDPELWWDLWFDIIEYARMRHEKNTVVLS